MLTFVIPTVDSDSGVATARDAMKSVPGSRAVVVVDGSNRSTRAADGSLTVIRISGLGGSYHARNVGLREVDTEFVCFLDDGISISSFPESMDGRSAVGPVVWFEGQVRDLYEDWYRLNAFDIERFITRDNFIPTLGLIVPVDVCRAVGGFRSELYSSGDVEFCSRIAPPLVLKVDKSFVVYSGSRDRKALRPKMKRQTFGRSHYWDVKYGSGYRRLRCFAALVRNILGLAGSVPRGLGIVGSLRMRVVNYRICLWKVGYYCRCIFASTAELQKLAQLANSTEVRKW